MARYTEHRCPDRALAAALEIRTQVRSTNATIRPIATPAKPCAARLRASLTESPFDLASFHETTAGRHKRGTVLYLAYGSNLSIETFRQKRGIQPLAQVNVQVPLLRLTFDLPSIPYVEPCFANSGLRDPDDVAVLGEKEPLVDHSDHKPGYRKDRWHKGLIGVVYEVTPEDYAHIIATEGGGASYQDILVDCYPLEGDDPTIPIPDTPTTTPFKAHTLFAPTSTSGQASASSDGRFQRPDTSYAQPSARYLKLITDGAAELELPYDYQEWLHSLRPYQRTTFNQSAGMTILLAMWAPIIAFLFLLGRIFSDKKTGQAPPWLKKALGNAFANVWRSYDRHFKTRFGDGERTIGDNPGSAVQRQGHVVNVEKQGRIILV